jgi:hypothetical protein
MIKPHIKTDSLAVNERESGFLQELEFTWRVRWKRRRSRDQTLIVSLFRVHCHVWDSQSNHNLQRVCNVKSDRCGRPNQAPLPSRSIVMILGTEKKSPDLCPVALICPSTAPITIVFYHSQLLAPMFWPHLFVPPRASPHFSKTALACLRDLRHCRRDGIMEHCDAAGPLPTSNGTDYYWFLTVRWVPTGSSACSEPE